MLLADVRSDQHRIELRTDPSQGLILSMNGMFQLSEAQEHRYHESLVVYPLLHGHPRRVFVGGGGDGLAATRLLRFEEIEEIVVCDVDAEMLRLAREQPQLLALNEGSLHDPRVRVVCGDAVTWLAQAGDERFGLIVCDFPDAWFPETDALYTRELYELCRSRLTPDGLLVTQTLCEPEPARIIQATLGAVFPHVRFYLPVERHGFTLAANRPLTRVRPAPAWTRFIDDRLADGFDALGKDDAARLLPDGEAPNRRGERRVVKAVLALAAVRGGEAWPDPRRPRTLRIRLEGEPAPDAPSRALLLEALAERAELLVGVDAAAGEALGEALPALGLAPTGRTEWALRHTWDEGSRRLWWSLWDALGPRPRGRVHEVLGRPRDLPSVAAALERLASDHAALLLDRPARTLLVEGASGELLALFELDEPGERAGVVRVTLALGLGSARDHVFAALSAMAWLREGGATTLEAIAPDHATRDLLVRLGFRVTRRYDLFASAARRPES